MTGIAHAIEGWARLWSESLWHASWWSALLIVAAIAISLLRAHVSSRVLCWIWRLVCVKTLIALVTKSHWLDIEYHDGDAKQEMVLRLDKSEYEKVLSTLEARTGKTIARLDTKTSPLNPTANSKDVDQVIPFQKDAVAAALRPAMENVGCKVKETNAKRIECKRERGNSERTGYGGEQVTAEFEAKGEQTRVRIWTGKGFVGRIRKNNWSTPIYDEMMKTLQKPAQNAAAANTM